MDCGEAEAAGEAAGSPRPAGGLGAGEGSARSGGALFLLCTACGEHLGVQADGRHEGVDHPVLPGLAVCRACCADVERAAAAGFQLADDGATPTPVATPPGPLLPSSPPPPAAEEHSLCSWCGDPGNLILCDCCPRAFCQGCLARNLGGVADIVDAMQWLCPACEPSQLRVLQLAWGRFQTELVALETEGRPEVLLERLQELETLLLAAQDSLEDSHLHEVKTAVRGELASLHPGLAADELDVLVTEEMAKYSQQWNEQHAAVAESIAALQERIDHQCLVQFYRGWEGKQPELALTSELKAAPRMGQEPSLSALHARAAAETSMPIVPERRGQIVPIGADGYFGNENRPENWYDVETPLEIDFETDGAHLVEDLGGMSDSSALADDPTELAHQKLVAEENQRLLASKEFRVVRHDEADDIRSERAAVEQRKARAARTRGKARRASGQEHASSGAVGAPGDSRPRHHQRKRRRVSAGPSSSPSSSSGHVWGNGSLHAPVVVDGDDSDSMASGDDAFMGKPRGASGGDDHDVITLDDSDEGDTDQEPDAEEVLTLELVDESEDEEAREATVARSLKQAKRLQQKELTWFKALRRRRADASEGEEEGSTPIVNNARTSEEDPFRLHEVYAGRLKPHQLEGISFMWNNLIDRVVKAGPTRRGKGCMLAHSMGLGKTVQVIAFLNTIHSHPDLTLRRFLIAAPVNTLENWRCEFQEWLPPDSSFPVRCFSAAGNSLKARCQLLREWHKDGGALIMGHGMLQLCVNSGLGSTDGSRTAYTECLVRPGPDIVVVDEGHLMGGTKKALSLALHELHSRRRIILTGTPLQNSIIEYYSMVEFIRPGILGRERDFNTKFVEPIRRGQDSQSSKSEVKKMRKRIHVLLDLFKSFVHRRDASILKQDLPDKHEFVLYIRMTRLQKRLYNSYLQMFDGDQPNLFAAWRAMMNVWNHPETHRLTVQGTKSSEESNDIEIELDEDQQPQAPAPRPGDSSWWRQHMNPNNPVPIEESGKSVVVLQLLHGSLAAGDRVLVFSQSLKMLGVLQDILQSTPVPPACGIDRWVQGQTFDRLDGSTSAADRQKLATRLNNPASSLRLLLISLGAGCLGINLTGANRVILFDSAWNPAKDLQAMFRSYRYGQHKSVFVYRLIALGTLEEHIYKQQVFKQAISLRVVDDQHISRQIHGEKAGFQALDMDSQPLRYDSDWDSGSDGDGDTISLPLGTLGARQPQPQPLAPRAGPGTQASDAGRAPAAAGAAESEQEPEAAPRRPPPADKVLAAVILKDRGGSGGGAGSAGGRGGAGRGEHRIRDYCPHDSLLEPDEEEGELSAEDALLAWEEVMAQGGHSFASPTSAPGLAMGGAGGGAVAGATGAASVATGGTAAAKSLSFGMPTVVPEQPLLAGHAFGHPAGLAGHRPLHLTPLQLPDPAASGSASASGTGTG